MRRLVLLLLPALAFAVEDGPITIVEAKGKGRVSTGMGLRDMVQNLAFKPGSAIITEADGTATLWLGNGSKLIVMPDAEVSLNVLKLVGEPVIYPEDGKSIRERSPSVTEIEVIKGKVVGDVKRLAPESVYTLKTPVGIVRIKGTVFAVEFKRNADGTGVFNVGCARGLVQVEMPGMKAPVAIKPGMQLSMSAAAPPPPASKPADGQPAGDKPPAVETAAPPPPPPAFNLAPLPPSPEVNAAIISHGGPPPPPPNAPPPPPEKPSALDTIMQNVEQAVHKGQLDLSPTGG